MILLPDERYSIEHQVERIAKIYKVYTEKNELKNDSLIEWISLFRRTRIRCCIFDRQTLPVQCTLTRWLHFST